MALDRDQQLDRPKLPGLRERLWGSAIWTLGGKCVSGLALFGIHIILAKTLPVARTSSSSRPKAEPAMAIAD